jgi:polygalacturonase
MKRFLAFLLTTVFIINVNAQLIDRDLNYFKKKVPFTMADVVEPSFTNNSFNVKDFGGVADGKTLNTEAIAKAIIACNKQGGGKVIISSGTWLTGPIELLSNVNLVLEKGAILQFTGNHKEYPIIKAGKGSNTFTVASPIYAYAAKNIAITGEGIVDGAGETWRPVKKAKTSAAYWDQLVKSGGVVSADGKVWWPSVEAMDGEGYLQNLKSKGKSTTAEDYLPARDFLRPYMVYFVECENILLHGVTLRNSPKFVFYPNRCVNVSIKGVNVFNEWWAQNGDGIDISACRNVVIYNTTVSAGDDAICMKSSSGKSTGTEANLQNVLIANCIVYRGHGGFVIGSNTDGGMKNIFVTNCSFNGTDVGIRVKSNSGRGGKVEDIYIDSIEMDNIKDEAISFDTYYEDVVAGKEKKDVVTSAKDKVPEFTRFYISNTICKKASTGLYINGLSYMPVHDISFTNVSLTADKSADIIYAKNITGTNITFKSKKKFSLKDAENIVFNGEVVK